MLTKTEDGYQLVLTKTEGGSETVTTEDFTNDEMSRFISEGKSGDSDGFFPAVVSILATYSNYTILGLDDCKLSALWLLAYILANPT